MVMTIDLHELFALSPPVGEMPSEVLEAVHTGWKALEILDRPEGRSPSDIALAHEMLGVAIGRIEGVQAMDIGEVTAKLAFVLACDEHRPRRALLRSACDDCAALLVRLLLERA
jgi:hypothetical protein